MLVPDWKKMFFVFFCIFLWLKMAKTILKIFFVPKTIHILQVPPTMIEEWAGSPESKTARRGATVFNFFFAKTRFPIYRKRHGKKTWKCNFCRRLEKTRTSGIVFASFLYLSLDERTVVECTLALQIGIRYYFFCHEVVGIRQHHSFLLPLAK